MSLLDAVKTLLRDPRNQQMTKDPIDILELERPFTVDQLEKAFKKRARQLHPDHGGTKEQFQELNTAYEQLKKETDEKKIIEAQ